MHKVSHSIINPTQNVSSKNKIWPSYNEVNNEPAFNLSSEKSDLKPFAYIYIV